MDTLPEFVQDALADVQASGMCSSLYDSWCVMAVALGRGHDLVSWMNEHYDEYKSAVKSYYAEENRAKPSDLDRGAV